jgi:UPF0042 nucleotide-binding protein
MDSRTAALVILTGMSGAGKSTALRCFEDLGYFCIDNLPPGLISTFLKLYDQTPHSAPGVAVVSDIRSGELFEDFAGTIAQLRAEGVEYELILIDCDEDELIRRYKTTRRTPPLGGQLRLEDALAAERKRLAPVKELATLRIDTSQLSPEQLRQRVLGIFSGDGDGGGLSVTLLSFGFKHGAPADADFVIDARWLPNPFYVDGLRELTGNDEEVFDFVMRDPSAAQFTDKVAEALLLAFERYPEVAKYSALVAVGCTGGHHRSVSLVNYLESLLRKAGVRVAIQHRDISLPQ